MNLLLLVFFFLGSLNCAAFVAGIVEAFLNGTGFVSSSETCPHILLLLLLCLFVHQPCKVRAFSIKDQSSTVAFEIKFEDSVITRDKLLETMK